MPRHSRLLGTSMHATPTQYSPKPALIASLFALIAITTVLLHTVWLSPLETRSLALSSAAADQLGRLNEVQNGNAGNALKVTQSLRRFADTLMEGGELQNSLGTSVTIKGGEYDQASAQRLRVAINAKNDSLVGTLLAAMLAEQQQQLRRIHELRSAVWLGGFLAMLALGVWSIVALRKNLRRTLVLLSASLRENKTILESTKDGLFIIKPNFQVGSVQSLSLRSLFGTDQAIRGDFFDFLKERVSSSDLAQIKAQVSRQLTGSADGAAGSLNHKLDAIEVTADLERGYVASRHLNFEFARNDLNPAAGLLVSVSDATAEVALREKVREVEKVNEERFQLLTRSIVSEAPDVTAFFRAAHNSLKKINAVLRDDAQQHADNTQKAKEILESASQLKLQAGELGISLIEMSAHQLEADAQALIELSPVTAKQLLGLTAPLKRLISEMENLELLTKKYHVHRAESRANLTVVNTTSRASVPDEQILQLGGRKVATKLGKKVVVNLVEFNCSMIQSEARNAVEQTLGELVENAVVHSIELPEVRRRSGKPTTGSITIRMEECDAEHIRLYVQDDGAGFDFDALRTSAVGRGLVDPDVCNKLSKNELVRLIFISGFSTTPIPSANDGVGMGLENVKAALSKLGGKISVGSADGITAQFAVVLPKSVLIEPFDQANTISA